jgi:hypothetical protein
VLSLFAKVRRNKLVAQVVIRSPAEVTLDLDSTAKISAVWRFAARTWKAAINHFAILYAARFLQPTA